MNKKFQLNQLFTSYAQFCNCAPGADTSADFDSLQGSAVAARKRIVAIIGNNTFSDIVSIEEEESGIKDFLRAAMANLTLATQIIFDAVTIADKRLIRKEELLDVVAAEAGKFEVVLMVGAGNIELLVVS
jgi:hypothetical protein